MKAPASPSSDVGGVTVAAPRDEARTWSLPIPTWALVGGVFALSFVVRLVYALRDPAPWIFNDEIQYSELAKALAYDGEFAIREVNGTGGFPILYPILIAPAFALFDSVPDAYDGARAINCLLMSATVVPVYLLARRVAGRGWSLVAAAFSVAVPALMLTGTMMSENAFYPLVALWLLVAIRALEKPTIARQAVVLGVIGLAFLARPQGVVLVPILVTAIALVVLLDSWADRRWPSLRRLWTGLWAYWATWLILGVGAIAAIVRQGVRGKPLNELLGSYAGVTQIGGERSEYGTWALWHLAEADIFLGVFPLAAFIAVVLAGLRPAEDRSVRLIAALGLPTVAVFLAVVTVYASSPTGDRILERNFFHVVPLFFVALAAWGSRASIRRWWTLAPAALLAGTLTLALPLNNFLNGTIVHSTPGLLPIWRWRDRAFSVESIDEVIAVAAIAGAAVFVLIPRRMAPAVAVVLAVYFAAAARPVESFTWDASNGAYVSALGAPKDWVDRKVGRDAHVATVWMGGSDAFSFWETEFFNRSVGRAYTALGAWDGLVHAIEHVQVRPNGAVVDLEGRSLRLRYAVTDSGTTYKGRRLATNGARTMSLFEINGPLVTEERYDGLFPDRWSGPIFIYKRYQCRGGTLELRLESSPAIHRRPFSVRVLQHGAPTGALRFRPREQFPTASVPLRPRDGACDVLLEIPTGSAAASTPGDLRQLGLRFLDVRYVASR